jgi:hypothetical protein
MSNRDRYTAFCKEENNLPVFYQPWWLDIVCAGGKWDAILFERNHEILGVFPYFLKRKFGIFKVITMPPYTPFLGPYMKFPENLKSFERIGYEKEVLSSFIKELPEFDKFIQFFNYDFSNWLPFYWQNFKQTTYYSYVIENISDAEKVISHFHPNKQQEIRKAAKTVEIKFDLSPEEFYCFHKESLEKTNQKISYSLNLFKSIFDIASENNSGRIIYATDNEKIYSALFLVWDKNSAYSLITANDPDLKKSGTLSLLIYKAIIFLSNKTQMYDFEGSMNENIEFSYRQFGGVQKQYFYITKTNSIILKSFEYLNYFFNKDH